MRKPGEPLFDFPCSYTFRCYEAFIDEGIYLPEIDPPEAKESDIELRLSLLEAAHSQPGSIPRWYHDRTQQLEGRVLHAETKLQEHITAQKKPKPKGHLKGIET